MRIEQVKIDGLFSNFNYVIDMNDPITIIHGPNGCGKTTVFRIIDAVFNRKIDVLFEIEFSSVQFVFSDRSTLRIKRKSVSINEDNPESKRYIYFVYTICNSDGITVLDSNKQDTQDAILAAAIRKNARVLPWLRRIGDDIWMDARENKTLTIDEVMELYGEQILRRVNQNLVDLYIPDQVSKLVSKFDVRLISADRLTVQRVERKEYGSPDIKIEQQVNIFAADLAKRIQKVIQQYALLSQEKDRTFLNRVIKNPPHMTLEQIKEKITEQENTRKKFIDAGILEESKDSINIEELINSITENEGPYLSLLSLNVLDNEEKLAVLSGLSESINVFREWIDKNFKYKHIEFSKEYGFQFKTDYSHAPIPPDRLSSGEQHELVMFYDLIFNTSDKTLILIDEPELSLHIEWQLDYVDTLLRTSAIVGFSAILSTHSPQIINGKWNLVESLINKK